MLLHSQYINVTEHFKEATRRLLDTYKFLRNIWIPYFKNELRSEVFCFLQEERRERWDVQNIVKYEVENPIGRNYICKRLFTEWIIPHIMSQEPEKLIPDFIYAFINVQRKNMNAGLLIGYGII